MWDNPRATPVNCSQEKLISLCSSSDGDILNPPAEVALETVSFDYAETTDQYKRFSQQKIGKVP
jgi:hypothetical protein